MNTLQRFVILQQVVHGFNGLKWLTRNTHTQKKEIRVKEYTKAKKINKKKQRKRNSKKRNMTSNET
jgi:hypothetical protein